MHQTRGRYARAFEFRGILAQVKVVILAGGLGTRLAEETRVIPKPMIEIGGRPMIVRIMEHYAKFGFNDFILALGYKGSIIKDHFLSYQRYVSDIEIDFQTGVSSNLNAADLDWKVTLVDTGQGTMTGGRIRRLAPYLLDTFMLTYGDGLSNVALDSLLSRHRSAGVVASVTAVMPPPRFGAISIEKGMVKEFSEKPIDSANRINGGFFVMEPEIMDYLSGDSCILESDVLPTLALQGQLAAFPHDGFWMPMDTLRDRENLEKLAEFPTPPWEE